jgi:hypothetical protein
MNRTRRGSGGKLVSLFTPHNCKPQPKRLPHGSKAVWQCECGQAWDWMCTYAGCGWHRHPDWVDYWRAKE